MDKKNKLVTPPTPIDSRPICLLEERQAYGHTRIYPKNLAARLLCQLTQRRTFSKTDLETIETLGFELRFVDRIGEYK